MADNENNDVNFMEMEVEEVKNIGELKFKYCDSIGSMTSHELNLVNGTVDAEEDNNLDEAPVEESEVEKTPFRKISDRFRAALYRGDLSKKVQNELLICVADYEEKFISIMLENERLRGRVEDMSRRPALNQAVAQPSLYSSVLAAAKNPETPKAAVATAFPALKKVIRKEGASYAVVVKSTDPTVSNADIQQKLARQLAPEVKVRVSAMKPIASGGIVVKVPTEADKNLLVVAREKFTTAGLSVTESEVLPYKVIVFKVNSELTEEILLKDMHEHTLKDVCSLEELKKNIKFIAKPSDDEYRDVHFTTNARIANALERAGKIYVWWHSFRVKVVIRLNVCFKCLGHGHQATECRYKSYVCGNCCQEGHLSAVCANNVFCRECAARKLPANHRMLTDRCPVFLKQNVRRY